MLEIFAHHKSSFLQTRTESLKPCIVFHDRMRCVMVCKIPFTNWNAKIPLLRESMIVTYYIKLFRMGADRHNGFLTLRPLNFSEWGPTDTTVF